MSRPDDRRWTLRGRKENGIPLCIEGPKVRPLERVEVAPAAELDALRERVVDLEDLLEDREALLADEIAKNRLEGSK